MNNTPAPAGELEPARTLNADLARKFADMAMLIPDETGDANERILAQVLAATTLDSLDDPWESTSAETLAGKQLLIRSCLRRPSDFRDGLGIFLVVDCLDVETGEAVIFTTSALAVVAQLVRAYALAELPAFAEIVVAKRPTERGYHPHHLKFTGKPAMPSNLHANDQPGY